MKPTTGVAAAASSSSSSADDGASSGKEIINVSGGEPVPELPLLVMEKILRCMNPLEAARVATVCKSWAAAVSKRVAADLAPHLFIWLQPLYVYDIRGVIVPAGLDGHLPPPAISAPDAWARARFQSFLPKAEPDSTPRPRLMETVPADGGPPYFRDRRSCVVVSGGKTLLVSRTVQYREPAQPWLRCEHNRRDLAIRGFEVSRLDGETWCWVRGEKLGDDQALFVNDQGQQRSFAVRASETQGCRARCIYYVRETGPCDACPPARRSWRVWGVYSMDERKVLFERPFIASGRCAAALWFLPRVADLKEIHEPVMPWDVKARV